jgi:hypothetical protein
MPCSRSEVDWRSTVVRPAARFVDGTIDVSDRPGLGIDLDDEVIRALALAKLDQPGQAPIEHAGARAAHPETVPHSRTHHLERER